MAQTKYLLCLGVFAALVFTSCKLSPDDKNLSKGVAATATIETEQSPRFILPSDSGYIKLGTITDGEIFFQTRKELNQTIYIEFRSEGYKKVSADLSSPDSLANIRFSQIFLPDGTMDGPFGRHLDYQLPADGIYKLSVHENMMAGDPWGGDFRIRLKLEK